MNCWTGIRKKKKKLGFLTVTGVRQCGATYSLYLIKKFPLTKITNYYQLKIEIENDILGFSECAQFFC